MTGTAVRLTTKMERFVAEYVVTRNGAESARRAGYSANTAYVIAYENLRKPQIVAALAAKEAELAVKLDIDRTAVIGGIFEAMATARSQGDAGQVIRGWCEVAKLTGLDKPEMVKLVLSPENERLRAKFEAMSDEELLAIEEGRTVARAHDISEE